MRVSGHAHFGLDELLRNRLAESNTLDWRRSAPKLLSAVRRQ